MEADDPLGAQHPPAPVRRTAGELDGISEKVLIQQLRELQRDGIVDRAVHEQVPPKVVYSLTPLGETLDRALAPLGDWGEANLAHILEVRAQ